MTFKELGIIEPILMALKEKGYTQPTPIQEQSIPILLNRGDLLGSAQTGTGKTAAFAIPIIQNLHTGEQPTRKRRPIRSLVITPTRELAIQIADNFILYSKHTQLRTAVIFGGVKQKAQTDTLRQGIDILVATPGRLLDLMSQGYINLDNIKMFVLDEADHMLDMGFINDIKKVLAKLPTKRQSLFFSATMPSAIVKLSHNILTDHQKVAINPEQTTAERVEQSVYFVSKGNKVKLLVDRLNSTELESTLVFSRTKHGANKIVKILNSAKISAEAIHGNKSQGARQKSLSKFKSGELKVLVATDIAARGIDVSGLSLVVNYDLPNVAETYVHRIGRTGRANASGEAISFCDGEERPYLKDIEKLIEQKIEVVKDHDYVDDGSFIPSPKKGARPPRKGREGNSRNSNRSSSDRRGGSSRPDSNRRGGEGGNRSSSSSRPSSDRRRPSSRNNS